MFVLSVTFLLFSKVYQNGSMWLKGFLSSSTSFFKVQMNNLHTDTDWKKETWHCSPKYMLSLRPALSTMISRHQNQNAINWNPWRLTFRFPFWTMTAEISHIVVILKLNNIGLVLKWQRWQLEFLFTGSWCLISPNVVQYKPLALFSTLHKQAGLASLLAMQPEEAGAGLESSAWVPNWTQGAILTRS